MMKNDAEEIEMEQSSLIFVLFKNPSLKVPNAFKLSVETVNPPRQLN